MRKFILIITALCALTARAQLLEEDKQAHIIAGTIIGAPTFFFNKSVFKIENTYLNFAVTTGEGLIIGWAFEHYQKFTGRGVYDNMDIIATATGFFAGSLLGRVLEHDPNRFHKKTLRRQKRVERYWKRQMKKINKRKDYYEKYN